ncbi:hypothetical protein [Streptomyces lasiicapitis]|uniref:hypothetical protein n=1 Tax=Streptomyces lasiicapitis TaxID=1923961 RepID=UPI003647475E
MTDGRVAGYEPLVAVLRLCNEVAPQETLLEPQGGNAYRIVWYHPDHGKGCLKALDRGSGLGLLEPWEACEQSTLFRIEPFGANGSRQYVLRVDGQGCVAIKGARERSGTAVVMEPCRYERGHVFVIAMAP